MPASPAPNLWDFAVACYERPGIAEHCLAWQTAGGDVCLLLCAVWLECRGVPFRGRRLTALQTLAEPWQAATIRPLRTLRGEWKKPAATDPELAALRARLAELELQAERLLLQRLEHLGRGWPAESGGALWLEALATGDTFPPPALAQLREAARALYSD